MKILLDVNTPVPLGSAFRGHQVVDAVKAGWQSLANGALLDAAERAGFDVLVTCDQNLSYQQNFAGRKISVVVLSTNDWPTLRRVGARIATRVEFVQRGQVVRVDVGALLLG